MRDKNNGEIAKSQMFGYALLGCGAFRINMVFSLEYIISLNVCCAFNEVMCLDNAERCSLIDCNLTRTAA